MKAIGIDTVILIRASCAHRRVSVAGVAARGRHLPVYEDLADLFLDLAEENGMDFLTGTYDSVSLLASAPSKSIWTWAAVFIDEAWARYGRRAAFRGWYLTFEICA